MKIVRQYGDYNDYLNHQKEKTLDPVRRRKWLNEEWQIKVDGFKEILKPYKDYFHGLKALCIGARTGQEVVALNSLGATAIGVDICPHEPHVVEGDMHSLPFENQSFDFVFSNVLDHSLYPKKKISEIERVLKKGGKSILHLQVNIPSDIYTEAEVNNVHLDVLPLFERSFCLGVNNLENTTFATMNKEIIMERSKTDLSIQSVAPHQEYLNIWTEVNLPTQVRKAKTHNLSDLEANECFQQLRRRPFYLASLAKEFGCKTFAEVGTAKGLQSFSFAEYMTENNINGHVWTCDILDQINKEYKSKYKNYITFCLGDSKVLAQNISKANAQIDMFYIDGAHGQGDVIRDVFNLKNVQSENPIWVFDDYDKRFGCYRDINRLIENKKNFKVYRVGNTASGNPSHQVVVRGRY